MHDPQQNDPQFDQPFWLGDWYVEPASDSISREEERIRLEPRVMEVLVYLARRPGEVAQREAIEASVWEGVVVGYDALTSTMLKLRKALDDDPRHPGYIETVPKRGYRLIADVRPLEEGEKQEVPARIIEPDLTAPERKGRWLYAISTLALLVVLGVALTWYGDKQSPQPDSTVTSNLSIAVLPFDNISGDESQQYYADGIVSDLITDLSRIPELAVIARDTTFLYREDQLDRIRRDLGVQYVLRGSVRRDADTVRINAQLVDTDTGRHLWAQRFDASFQESFAMQDAITGRIAEVLKLHAVTGRDSMVDRYSSSVEAYDLFLRGLDHLGRRTREDLDLAQDYYQQAINLDPGFARAYANLALVNLRHAVDGWEVNAEGLMDRAKLLAEQALGLNDRLAEVHFVNAFVDLFRREYDNAISSLEKALAIRPSYADAYALLAWVHQFSGRPDLAESGVQQAIRLNPYTPAAYLQLQGEAAFTEGRYRDAIAHLEQAQEKSPVHPRSHIVLAASHALAGDVDDARWMVDQLLVLDPMVTRDGLREAFPYRNDEDLQRLMNGLEIAGLP